MHYSNLVIIRRDDEESLDAAVETAMGPHEDRGGFWDWFQIGGRWSGVLDGYDPQADPQNQRLCEYCENGITTQAVADRFPAYKDHVGKTCIQCKGKGFRPAWPTEWKQHPGDVMPLDKLTDEQYEKFYRIVDPEAQTWGGERYEPWHDKVEDRFQREPKPPLDWLKQTYKDHLIVVVDNHS